MNYPYRVQQNIDPDVAYGSKARMRVIDNFLCVVHRCICVLLENRLTLKAKMIRPVSGFHERWSWVFV